MVTQKINGVKLTKIIIIYSLSDSNLYLVEAPALKPAEIIMDPEHVMII